MKKASSTRMTEGPIWKRIILFAIPLFLGNLFQQLYNAADSLIVGNFLGSNALAAVSSSGNLISLMVGLFNGISVGAGVVVARYYGAREINMVRKSIHTIIAFGIAAGLVLTVFAVSMSPIILRWMGTPEEVLPNSIVYFRVYFAGSLAFVLYNIFVGILQAVGDSRHPLMYLIISSLVNVVLDLFFVGLLGLGVGSAAFATVISQAVSAVLCLIHLMHGPEEYRVSLKMIHFDPFMLRQIINNGFPAGLQNSIISLANVVVQSNINTFGSMAMAGCGSYAKIEGFGFLPVTCFALSLTTFVSQNLGAGQYERVKKGAVFGILCSVTAAEAVGIAINILSPSLIGLFNTDPQVIAYGVAQAKTVTLFYFLLAFSHCMAGIFRGAGKSIVPMLVMMICWCVIRVAYITVAVRFFPVITTVFWAYPMTWALSSVVFLIYYRHFDLTGQNRKSGLRGEENGSIVIQRGVSQNHQ